MIPIPLRPAITPVAGRSCFGLLLLLRVFVLPLGIPSVFAPRYRQGSIRARRLYRFRARLPSCATTPIRGG